MGYRGLSASLMAGLLTLALGAGMLAASGAPCRAQDEMIVNKVDLVDADLQAAVRALMVQTGAEIVIESSDKPYGRVTLLLERRPLGVVLKSICRAAGASVRLDSGVYVIGPKDAVGEPTVDKPKVDPDEKQSQAVEQPAPRRPGRVERIRLQNSRPSEILSYLGHGTDMVGEIMRRLMLDGLPDVKGAYQAAQAKMPTMANLNSSQVPPVVPTANVTDTARIGAGGEERQFMGGGGGGMMGGGMMGGGQMGGRGGMMGGGQMGGRGGLGGGLGGGGGQFGGGGGGGGQAGQGLVPDDIESVIAYDVDNTLIVRGSDDAIRELKEIIRLLDIAPRQLMIKAEFVEVSQNDLRQFGIDWQLARGNLVAGAPGFAAGQVFLNYATGNVALQLRTSLTEGKGRLVSSPMVTTLNNLPVTLSIGRQVPVFYTSPVAAGNGTVVLQTQVQAVNASSGMLVAPRINGDDSISLTIYPYVEGIAGQVTSPSGDTAPILTYQQIGPITRRIRNNDTIVIAGLVTKNDGTSIKKVPLFGDLPFIGQLFRSHEYTVNDDELLVFVTPSIIQERTGTGTEATTGATAAPRP